MRPTYPVDPIQPRPGGRTFPASPGVVPWMVDATRIDATTTWHVPVTRWSAAHMRFMLPRLLLFASLPALLLAAIAFLLLIGHAAMPSGMRALLLAVGALQAWVIWATLVRPARLSRRAMESDGPLTLELGRPGATIRGPRTMRRYAGPQVRVIRFDGWTLLQRHPGYVPDLVSPRAASFEELRDIVMRAELGPAPGEPTHGFSVARTTPTSWFAAMGVVGAIRWSAAFLVAVAVAVELAPGHESASNLLAFFAAYAIAACVIGGLASPLTEAAHPLHGATFGFDEDGITTALPGYVERISWDTCKLVRMTEDDHLLVVTAGVCARLVPRTVDAEPYVVRALAARHAPASLLPGDESDPMAMRLVPRGALELTVAVLAFGSLLRAYTRTGQAGADARQAFESLHTDLVAGAVAALALTLLGTGTTLVSARIDPVGRRAR